MINLDRIIGDSIKYISKRTDQTKFQIRQTYIRELGKQQDRYVYKNNTFHISDEVEEQLKINALKITGRYYRRYYEVK